ncbi:hypothetical protein DPMN_166845 [Dreissena polymorpha]|uniref:Uncharacterized protein n=1 Tax=Dreissena polymorpha TaxID=45954 RepID=A0A9D4EYQ8_DREPO|nr:hypothetical protein DPMN_166845 [Dreissena polymorpha]
MKRRDGVKIMEVSRDCGTQYAQRSGKTVLGFGSTACGVQRGNKSGEARDELGKGLFLIASALLAEKPCRTTIHELS